MEELGHKQPATILRTDNQTALGFAQNTIKQKRSRTFDRQFWWLKDRATQQQFYITWGPGKSNLADYFTKHHPGSHHKLVRPIYLHEATMPTTLQGCIEVFGAKAVRAYHLNTRTEVRGTRTKEVQRHQVNTTPVPGIPNHSSHLHIPSHPRSSHLHKTQYLEVLKHYSDSLNKKA